MSDLKESGALEEDGDYIAILHRPYVLDKEDMSHTLEETTLLLDKNKFGKGFFLMQPKSGGLWWFW